MVGVGGRSKGCKTCRRRRVKCDEVKPSCERCIKGGFQCDGYVQYGEFKDLTTQLTKKIPPKRHTFRPTGSSTGSAVSPGSVTELPLVPLVQNPAWDEQTIFISHLVDRLFTWHENPSSPESASWVSEILQSSEDDGALAFASTRALATGYFAKTHHQSDLMRKGAGFYSRALSALRSQLQDASLVLKDYVLVAIICMAIYELVTFHQPAGWLHHYRGLAHLVVVRGPQRHQSGVGFSLLSTLRSCILIGYLVERKHCFLETTEWKTIPWAKVGLDAKLPLDKLHDILSDIPGYLEDIDLVGKWPQDLSSKEECLTKLRGKLLASLQALYSWRWEWEKDFPASTYSISPNGLDPETYLPLPPSPFESVLWFVDPYRANDLMTYNAIRVILTRLLELIGAHTDKPNSVYFSDPLLPMEGTRHDVAVEMCRMVDYHLHCFRRSSGAFLLIFPINIAYLHLDGNRDGRAKSWLEIVMALVADIHGFEIGRRENMPRQIDKVVIEPLRRDKKIKGMASLSVEIY